MGINIFKSEIENYFPDEPILFKNNSSGEKLTVKEIIKNDIPALSHGSSFYINPLLTTGHLQTAYTAVNNFENVDLVHYKRRILTVDSANKFYVVNNEQLKYDEWEGESTIAIDYVFHGEFDAKHERFKPESQKNSLPPRTEYLDPSKEQELLSDDSRPLVIALHGLSGGSYESYIRAFLSFITAKPNNFDALVLNARGCANHTLTSPQLFNGLWTNDLRYLINEHIKSNWPNKRIFLIGFSLGGAITANYLGQEADEVYHNIKGAAIMGAPWDFTDSSIVLQGSILGSNIYSPAMCQNLIKLLNSHVSGSLKGHPIIEEYIKNPEGFKVNKLKDFDDAFTSKFFGFNCANEYYRNASPVQRLLKVRVPTIIVNSKDDPIVGSRTLPYTETKLNPFANLITTSKGGHLGWFTLSGGRWYAQPIAQLFSELDKNWALEDVKHSSLPQKLDKVWKYDRIV